MVLWLFQAVFRTLSGVVNKISNIIPNSSDNLPSSTLPEWSDEDALEMNFTVNSSQVCCVKLVIELLL